MTHWCATEFLKHAISDYLVMGPDLFSLRFSSKNKETKGNSQHSNSSLVWLNQNSTLLLSDWQNIAYHCCAAKILVIYLCVPWGEKFENHCSRLCTIFWVTVSCRTTLISQINLYCDPYLEPWPNWGLAIKLPLFFSRYLDHFLGYTRLCRCV